MAVLLVFCQVCSRASFAALNICSLSTHTIERTKNTHAVNQQIVTELIMVVEAAPKDDKSNRLYGSKKTKNNMALALLN